MFLKRLKRFFLIIITLSLIFLLFSFYTNYQFNNNQLNDKILNKIKEKEKILKNLALKHYKIDTAFPIIISNNLPAALYGVTVYEKNNNIGIYLNKKRFQESLEYMIDDVLPHEYAHALAFKLKTFSSKKEGHSLLWQNICIKLQGLKCERFVNTKDIVFGKTNF